MIAVQSGNELAGRWTRQRRNIVADFQRAFGKRIGEIDAYAVMVDSDNGGGQSTGWFGRIDFEAEKAPSVRPSNSGEVLDDQARAAIRQVH